MIIKDRLIEVDITEALAIAGKGEKVRCVGEGTGLMNITDALEGLTFFAPESALTEPEPVRSEASKDEIAKLAKSAPIAMRYDTPEARTRAIIDSVERYDEEHEEPAKQEAKQEALAKEHSGEEAPAPVPFAEAPTGGAVK